jgi:curved DNA-binding protein CbpA
MKDVRQQNYYERLEIPPGASPLEIRRAYRKVFELYQDDSIASYSFFSDEERGEILAGIEEAYLALIDPEARTAYDRSLIAAGLMEEESRYRDKAREPVPIYAFQKKGAGVSPSVRRMEELRDLASRNPAIREILARGTLTGEDLQRLRTALAVPLEEIAAKTNIRIDILRAIEAENIESLPPPVYLKGFLKSYARCLAVDENAIAEGYRRGMVKNG